MGTYHWQDITTDILPNEIWVKLHINNMFSISSLGRIKEGSVFRKLYRTNKGGKGNGYLITCINGERQLVHKLVADIFVKNPNPKKFNQVNHLDGDKANPEYTNLEHCDNKTNVQHAFNIGLNKGRVGQDNYFATMCEDKVKAIIRIMATSSLSNRDGARFFGIPYSTMRKIKDGNHWNNLNNYRNIFQ